jgi:DNA-binding LacI/PurR family transcriptional regulator
MTIFILFSPTESDPKGLDMERLGESLPEAIFCEDDYIALRLLKAAQAAGDAGAGKIWPSWGLTTFMKTPW